MGPPFAATAEAAGRSVGALGSKVLRGLEVVARCELLIGLWPFNGGSFGFSYRLDVNPLVQLAVAGFGVDLEDILV